MDSWGSLFERAAAVDTDKRAVRGALEAIRGSEAGHSGADPDPSVSSPAESGPARVVADADVLAADLVLGGAARDALDPLRRHRWTTLLASDPLVDDAETVIAEVADPALAAAWRERSAAWRDPVSHPADDNPALGSAYRGGAMHLLTFDERLRSTRRRRVRRSAASSP